MAKIIGNTTTTPMTVPDWEQTNPMKADYIKNKPEIVELTKDLSTSGKAADAKAVGDALAGKQPAADYALRSELPEIPVQSVNGKTGDVKLIASDVGADPSGTASSAVSTHNTNTSAHNDIRDLITALTTRLNTLADSDDTTLDQISEIVAYIKSNKALIDGITTSKINVSDIVNNLTTNVSNKPLSAAQGVAIQSLIDALQAAVDSKAPNGNYVTYVSNANVDVFGTSKPVYRLLPPDTDNNSSASSGAAYFPEGIIMGGSALSAGLATRGICGINTAHASTGACAKDNLYLNYDGSNDYSKSRQVILQAGTAGSHYGNNVYQYAAVRGDALKGYCDNKYYDKTSIDTQLDTINGEIDGSIKELSVSGKTITYTKNDGTTGTITTQDTNTDTKVTQAAAITTNGEYPILLANSTATTEVTNTVNKTSTLKYNPSTKILTATTFKGALDGNAKTATSATSATSATKATQDASGNVITSTYETKTDADTKLATAKSYTDTAISNLINSAPTTLDTLGEIATAMEENADVVEALEAAVGNKANTSDLTSHTGNKSNPHGVTAAQVGALPTSGGTLTGAITSPDLQHIKFTTAGAKNESPQYVLTFYNNNAANGFAYSTTSSIAQQYQLPSRLANYQTAANKIEDPNLAMETGFYYVNGATNRPPFSQNINNDYRLLVTAYNDSWLQQIATDFRCDDVYYRRLENQVWKPWTRLALSSDVDTKQATITGGASTITSNNLTANRALLSDASGKVAVSAVTSTELGYLDGVTSAIQTQLDGKSESGHTHNYAGSSSVGGAATSANKLNTNDGSATNPVYFVNGVPVKTTYTLEASVPSDAKFTDTTYGNATTTAAGLMSFDDKTKVNYTNIAYGTCTTPAETVAKVITVSGNTKWALTAGSRITIKFSNTNTADNPTFNVNGTGAKKVWYNTGLITTSNKGYAGTANRLLDFVYDGTQYVFIGWSVDSNSDTKNTTGTTNKTATKLFLAGATAQGANPTTYSNSNVYIGTDNCLYSNNKVVATEESVDTKLSGKANSSHGNHVPTTQTADNATFLRNDNTWQKVTPANIGAVSQTSLDNHTNDTTVHITSAERSDWNAAKAHADTPHVPAYGYGTEDLTAGTSELESGKLYFVYE